MTQEEFQKAVHMAIKDSAYVDELINAINRAISTAVAAEREACAKIADGYRHDESRDGTLFRDDDCAADGTAFDIAAAIRARGDT